MKKILNLVIMAVLTAVILSSCTSTAYVAESPAYQDPGPVTYQAFYNNLSPYGNWIDYPGYGNVWNPNVGDGFRPYASNGQWRYSNEGWAWQSNYNWGWAPFHYGRWLYDDNYGWLWVPGYDWSPAWVTWGSVGNNYAWAPLMPEVNVGVQYNTWRPHSSYWNVVPREHVGDRNISAVIVNYNNNNSRNNNSHNNNSNNNNVTNNTTNNTNNYNNITNNITIINNYNTSRTNNYYAKGPDVNEVEKYTGRKIQPVTFKETNQITKPNQSGNVMEVYRPVVRNPHTEATAAGTQNNNQANGQNNHTTPGNSTPMPAAQLHVNQNNNNPVRQSNNNEPAVTPQRENSNHTQAEAQEQNQHQQQVQTPRSAQTAVVPNTQPVKNIQRPQNQQQVQTQPAPQPRVFRKIDASQTRPIRNEAQQPVMQPRQQQKNVQQLPVQRSQPHGDEGNQNNQGSRDKGRQ